MTDLISWPMRLTPNGVMATADDAGEAYVAEELAQMVQTIPGERELVPLYGLEDPAFGVLDAAQLASQVMTFGPPVEIAGVSVAVVSESAQDVVVQFRLRRTDNDLGRPVATELTLADEEYEYADA